MFSVIRALFTAVFLLVTVLSLIGFADVTETLSNDALLRFTNVYPVLYRSPLVPVAYRPTVSMQVDGVTPAKSSSLTSLLMQSYRSSTDYNALSKALNTRMSTHLASAEALQPVLLENSFTQQDVEETISMLSHSPTHLQRFSTLISENPSARQKILSLAHDVPTFADLLPSEAHRTVFRAVLLTVKQAPTISAKQKPVSSPTLVSQPWTSAPISQKVPALQSAPQPPEYSVPEISWVIRPAIPKYRGSLSID